MNLTEMAEASASTLVVRRDDPDAIRVKFVGFPPGELDSRHKDFEPSGNLMPGEMGMGKPARSGQVDGMWNFTSDRGFSMFMPPHDLKKDPKEERYPNLGDTNQKLMKSHHLADLMKDEIEPVREGDVVSLPAYKKSKEVDDAERKAKAEQDELEREHVGHVGAHFAQQLGRIGSDAHDEPGSTSPGHMTKSLQSLFLAIPSEINNVPVEKITGDQEQKDFDKIGISVFTDKHGRDSIEIISPWVRDEEYTQTLNHKVTKSLAANIRGRLGTSAKSLEISPSVSGFEQLSHIYIS